MKKIFFLFLMVFIYSSSVNTQNLTKQEMLEFYPYNVGNSWSYWWIYYNAQLDYSEAGRDKFLISGDTVINNIKYWLVKYDYGGYGYNQTYLERIDTTTGDVYRIYDFPTNEIFCVDNVYAGVGDTISISNNRNLLYCDKIVIKSLRDTVINNFHTTIREVVGLPSNLKLFFARKIGMLGFGKNYWIDSAYVNGIVFSNITDVKIYDKSVVKEYSLSQNYPNPFNPETNINYSLPKSGYVTIKIYDIAGIEIQTLVSEEKSSGSHSLQFNAKNFSSGIYFYQIRANGFTQTKKMILLK